ncbi:MAG: hypothetical protein SGI77_13220 [Pirellulaceae bacterium]|nr:hypothetical protein [Pirellulaceae bacterium]
MKLYVLAFAGLSAILMSGCEKTNLEYKADEVRDASQRQADLTRESHDHAADQLRNADGKTITGSARDTRVEKAADAIEDAGERKADAVESSGERKADELEKRRLP